jgi:hypothetical protein
MRDLKKINEAISIIEGNSVFKLSAMTDKGAFLIPVDSNGVAYSIPAHYSDKKILSLAEVIKNKPKGI